MSTFIAQKQYEPNLADHYPHDQYTMQPKYPPKRQKSQTNKALKVTKSKLPQISKENSLPLTSEESKRPVVYNCKHIADGCKKLHYDFDKLPRQEIGLHLVDDLTSMMFKAGLQNLEPGIGSDDPSYQPALINLGKVDPGVVNIVKRMHKPTTYPPINGKCYELGSHG